MAPLLVLMISTVHSLAQTRVYRNSEFGFEVPIPHGLYLFRPHEMNGIDHGRQFFFKPTSVEDCNHGGCDRYIEVDAYCNCTVDTAKLHDLLEHECTVFGGAECLDPPKGLMVKGMASESARAKLRDGRVEILVVTQAGKPDPNFDASVPSINYSIILLTNNEHLEEDLRFFRIILRTIRFFPPS
ncbi:MAG: hypothetical protein ACLQHF_12400 [Terracidiphilus sp.]